MKRLHTLLVLLFVAVTTNAQIITIPDANFKAKLLQSSPTADIAWAVGNIKIKIDTNDDGEIQQSEALLVVGLSVDNANIADLTGIESFTNLGTLTADGNQLTSFTLNGVLQNLSLLHLGYNNLTSVSLFNLNSLGELALWGNQISSVNLDNLPNLWGLWCNSNNLTSIDLTEFTNLSQIHLGNNQLSFITFPAWPNPNVPFEPYIDLSGNLFQTITLPNHYLGGGNYSNNPNLQYFNIKESFHGDYISVGYTFQDVYNFVNCPTLEYICAREEDISAAQYWINAHGLTNCHVNSYCTFTPGGTYYTLQGINTFDINNNGCAVDDIQITNVSYTISNGVSNTTLVAGTTGLFNYDVSAGTYTITPFFENGTNFTISPASATVTFPDAGASFTQNFCITANNPHNDLEIAIYPMDPARPGFDTNYTIVYKNKGTTVQNGIVSLEYYDPIEDFVSATPNFTSQSTNILNWEFSNLLPFETREITFTFNLNSPLEDPSLNAGNIIQYTSTITGTTDETPTDNTSLLNQTIVNSFDPNDKTCIEGANLPNYEVGKYLHYIIRFENTGTANAENIVVKDIIDITKFDISTLVPLNGSHPFETKISSINKVEFIFQNINLPFDDAINDGYVAFKIKTLSTLTEGAVIYNSANIYFDYNAPVVTNTSTVNVFNPLFTHDFSFADFFSLSPVPSKNALTITTKQTIAIGSVNIYNTLGQLVQVDTNPTETIDVSGLKTGNYFIKVISDKGIACSKFIKE